MPALSTSAVAAAPALLLAALASCGQEARPPATRTVIVITCDTLRADHLGAYGYPRPTSPHVDAFAADATSFDNAWTTAPMTAPALASMLSSRLPDEIGMGAGNVALLPPEVDTLPEILAREDVETAAVVSNWVLRRPPPEFARAGLQQGFAHFDDQMKSKEVSRDFFDRSGAETTDAAIAWLESRHAAPGARTFLWVHYQDPHGPYTPPAELEKLFESPPANPELRLPLGKTQTGHRQLPLYQIRDGERRPRIYRDRYDAEIREFDEAFGRLIEWLKSAGLYESALIVFTADHGESLGEHDYWFCHGENTYVEEVRVPLVVRFPSGARGVRRTELASLLDVFPTVIDAFGIAPQPCRGLSLFETSLPRDRIVPQSCSVEGRPDRWTAITSESARLVSAVNVPPKLFDRARDPVEASDLLAQEPARRADLLARLETFLAADPRPKVAHGILRKNEDLDTVTRTVLQQLGYVEGN